jgi:hypothetical protein
MSQEPDVYICEKILKKRISKGVPLYLIKWKDYPMKASTWEPVEHILDPELLTSFEDELRRKKTNKKKFKRTNQALVSTPEPQVSQQENGDQSSPSQPESPTPSAQTTKTRTPTPAPELHTKSPRETPTIQSNLSHSSPTPTPSTSSTPTLIIGGLNGSPTPPPKTQQQPEPAPKPENGTLVLAQKQLSPTVKISSPTTRTSEVQTSPRPRLSTKNAVQERPITLITDVTVDSGTITISESLCMAL